MSNKQSKLEKLIDDCMKKLENEVTDFVVFATSKKYDDYTIQALKKHLSEEEKQFYHIYVIRTFYTAIAITMADLVEKIGLEFKEAKVVLEELNKRVIEELKDILINEKGIVTTDMKMGEIIEAIEKEGKNDDDKKGS